MRDHCRQPCQVGRRDARRRWLRAVVVVTHAQPDGRVDAAGGEVAAALVVPKQAVHCRLEHHGPAQPLEAAARFVKVQQAGDLRGAAAHV
eukprot:266716-Chlamydomonas_euryale.AAC.2